MKTARLVSHSLRALSRYRLRTFFIMVTSFVGVAALTFVLSIGGGAQAKMLRTVRQIFGDSSFIVIAGGQQLMGGPRPDAARLTIDDIDAVVKALPEIDNWDVQQVLSSSARRGNVATTVRVLGQTERSEQIWSRSVSSGTYFDAASVKRMDRVALIGATVARNLFGNTDPLQAEISIDSVPFTVVGILETFGTDIHGMDRDNEIVIPISTLMRRVANVDTIMAAKLHVKDGSRVESIATAFRQLLRSRHGLSSDRPDDFGLFTPVEIQRMIGKVRQIISLYLPLASMIVLLVGGIVAATLMLASVNARTGEIGLRRAVGAHTRDISLQFLAESTLTLVGGGLIGIFVGLVAAQIVGAHIKLSVGISWIAILLGLLTSAGTGLLAGVIPARKAARIPPAMALR